MNKYTKQAEDFLKVTETTFTIKEATTQKKANWDKDEEKHINYVATLSNKRHSYTFNYWGSIYDYEIVDAIKHFSKMRLYTQSQFYPKDFQAIDLLKSNNIIARRLVTEKEYREKTLASHLPSSYDILACLYTMSEDNFEDWCSSFGYEVDNRQALENFTACIEQDRQLRKLFTLEELELLSDIA